VPRTSTNLPLFVARFIWDLEIDGSQVEAQVEDMVWIGEIVSDKRVDVNIQCSCLPQGLFYSSMYVVYVTLGP
jgi:hypothetical protein